MSIKERWTHVLQNEAGNWIEYEAEMKEELQEALSKSPLFEVWENKQNLDFFVKNKETSDQITLNTISNCFTKALQTLFFQPPLTEFQKGELSRIKDKFKKFKTLNSQKNSDFLENLMDIYFPQKLFEDFKNAYLFQILDSKLTSQILRNSRKTNYRGQKFDLFFSIFIDMIQKTKSVKKPLVFTSELFNYFFIDYKDHRDIRDLYLDTSLLKNAVII